jgi:hypothetical protein
MSNPFPGMDPFLEAADLWPDFHRRVVSVLHQLLANSLIDRYEVTIRRRQYPPDDVGAAGPCAEDFIEIRNRCSGMPVTLLDVVSPANKATDAGRQAYLASRQEGREAGASLVEVDLILQGRRTLDYSRDGLPAWDYAVTVMRQTQPERYEIYTSTLQKRLPRFRLPLAADERDTVLDLQTAVNRCYDQGDFASRIDYWREPPAPPGEADGSWVDELLTSRGLRAPAPPDDQVALAAYYLWEREGRPGGRDREHWLAVRRQLRYTTAPSTAPVPAAR